MSISAEFHQFLIAELGKSGPKKFNSMTPEWKAHYRRMYSLSKIRWSRPVSLSDSILELRHA
ncbi:MAG: hypothetical protein HY399_04755 [Elusimicrobia bacterium]|nr:hypothetical protein [Elusimicrobiota bacterium]